MKLAALLLIGLALSACISSPLPQGEEKRGVAVAHLAFVYWSIGPWWEPPGDEKQLKEFDDRLDALLDGGTGHTNK